MAVYLPCSIIGNSRILVTLGSHAEVMGFFYPHVDFAQNVYECLAALFLPEEGRPLWSFEGSWQGRQYYVDATNIVMTELDDQARSLRWVVSDMVPPSEDVMLRRFEVTNTSDERREVRLFQYFDLNLGEIWHKNSVRFLPERSIMVQFWRNLCFAVGGGRFDQWQCGKVGEAMHNSAKDALSRGDLNGQRMDIGNVNFAIGWDLVLPPHETACRLLVISPSDTEEKAVAKLQSVLSSTWDQAVEDVQKTNRKHLALAKPVATETSLLRAYERCLLAMPLLFDQEAGAPLAAPEFDPEYEMSGGYGYCWPRDAAETVDALAEAGFPKHIVPFLDWCTRTQSVKGYWHQRYWLSGEIGSTWCSYADCIQIDQVGAILHLAGTHLQRLPSSKRKAFARKYREMISTAAGYLSGCVGESGLHRTAFDLWESNRGSFAYSNAAVFAGLRSAALFAKAMGDEPNSNEWLALASRVKAGCLEKLWTTEGTQGYFVRGLKENGALDPTFDSSVLGLLHPFEMLSPGDACERAMIESTLDVLEQTLRIETSHGPLLRRFPNETYLGGAAGAVNSLWIAQVHLRLAAHYRGAGEDEAAVSRASQAERYLQAVLAHGTQSGLLPELVGTGNGPPYWAAAHGWCMGLLVKNVLLLDRLSANGANGREQDLRRFA